VRKLGTLLKMYTWNVAIQGRREGEGDMSPRKFPCWKNYGFLVNTLLQWLLALCLQLLEDGPSLPPCRSLPLDPAGGLLSPVPLFCPPPEQISGYALAYSVPKILLSDCQTRWRYTADLLQVEGFLSRDRAPRDSLNSANISRWCWYCLSVTKVA